jgi:potassium/chloride transporter 4/5/6
VPCVVRVGDNLSTFGVAHQSLTGAPRLLAAIANDDIIPALKYFKTPDDEDPHLATLFMHSHAFLGQLRHLGKFTFHHMITPVITMFWTY